MKWIKGIRDYFWPFEKVAKAACLEALSSEWPVYLVRNAGLYASVGILYTHHWANTLLNAIMLSSVLLALTVYNVFAMMQCIRKMDF